LKDYIARMFSDADGDPSAKRYVGVTMAMAGICFAIHDDYTAMAGCFGLASACLVMTPFEKTH